MGGCGDDKEDEEDDEVVAVGLYRLLEEAKGFSKPEISGFRVGAVAVGESGTSYLGGNVEFRHQGLEHVIHAEEFAITNAINHGERSISHLAVSMAPCGYCRQIISELAEASQLSIWISPSKKPTDIDALLPSAFSPKDLGGRGRLLSEQAHELELVEVPEEAWRPLADVALERANRSYAPYTRSPSGVALMLSCGKIVGGGYAENCAFNPSISPLKAAIVAVLSSQQRLEDVEKLVLVEMRNSSVSHESSISSFSRSLFPRAQVLILQCEQRSAALE